MLWVQIHVVGLWVHMLWVHMLWVHMQWVHAVGLMGSRACGLLQLAALL